MRERFKICVHYFTLGIGIRDFDLLRGLDIFSLMNKYLQSDGCDQHQFNYSKVKRIATSLLAAIM